MAFRTGPLLIVPLLIALGSAAPASPAGPFHVDREALSFKDAEGRTRIFHGVNYVFKHAPWLPPFTGKQDPQNSLNLADIQQLRQLGVNTIRLGLMWPGMETDFGVYNATYLEQAADLVKLLGDNGIYTVLDMHQDLLSRHFCGEGVPEFYVQKLLRTPGSRLQVAAEFPKPIGSSIPLDADGMPNLTSCLKRSFSEYYMSDAVGQLFMELFDTDTEFSVAWRNVWIHATRYFSQQRKDTAPYIIGYELLNEPFYGSVERHPSLLFGGAEKKLAQLYSILIPQMRLLAPTTPIFVERVPADFIYGFNSSVPADVLAYHVYCAPGWGRNFVTKGLCGVVKSAMEHTYLANLKTMRAAGFMTEFGAVSNNAGELSTITGLLDVMDDHLQSWAYWSYKLAHDITTTNKEEPMVDPVTGKLSPAKVAVLARPYVMSTRATLRKQQFDRKKGSFTITLSASPGQAVETVAYLGATHFGDSVRVAIAGPNGSASCFAATSYSDDAGAFLMSVRRSKHCETHSTSACCTRTLTVDVVVTRQSQEEDLIV